MIKEADLGNYSSKDSFGNIFESKVSSIPSTLSDKYVLELDGETYYLGKGEFDTEYRKIYKKSYFQLLYGLLCMSSKEVTNEIKLVVGLPLSQFKNDKDLLREMILSKYILSGTFNGCERNFVITDCEVYLEGIASVPIDYEGVFVDVGGRTTDAGITYMENGKRKVENPYSLPKGTINLYSDFIKLINVNHGLDLNTNKAKRVISNGLYIKNKRVDISKEMKIFKEYLDGLISDLNVQYSLNTNAVTFTGGGSLDLSKSIKRRVEHAVILEDSLFSNAYGFREFGRSVWER